MKIIKAGDFKDRSELENHVRNSIGLTTEKKDAVIEGTKQELARLHLSAATTFWGISCKVTDAEEKDPAAVPDRGAVVPSGIDGKLKTHKK